MIRDVVTGGQDQGISTLRVIIAGGGTGGHLFPGLALAEEMIGRKRQAEVLFVGTARGLESRIVENLGFRLALIDIGGIVGKGIIGSLANILRIPRSLIQSRRIIRSFRPSLAIGVGGYASGPVLIMARLAGIKTAVAEQNAVPGVTNRLLGHFVDRIFLTYPETADWFPRARTSIPGNPVRRGLFSRRPEGEVTPKKRFTLLVFGGSQGATAINDAFLASLPRLREAIADLAIIHQTGREDLDYIRGQYQQRGIEAEVHGFIMEMGEAYRRADLVVCRAGATSLAELTVLGKAAILIPYPHAAHDHQTKNAQALAARGAAVVIPESELNATGLARTIMELYERPERLVRMRESSLALGRAGAAAAVVDDCLRLVNAG